MPSSTDELRAKWGPGVCSALEHLEGKAIEKSGWIAFKVGYEPTEEDYSALEYLVDEWDYGFLPQREV